MENVCSDELLASAGFRRSILRADNSGLKLQIEVFYLAVIKTIQVHKEIR